MSINLPYLPTSYNLKELAEQYRLMNNPCSEVRLDGSSYFPRPNVDRLKELVIHVNDDEAKQILSVLLTEATKENGIVLSKNVVDALILMVTDSCGGPPEGAL